MPFAILISPAETLQGLRTGGSQSVAESPGVVLVLRRRKPDQEATQMRRVNSEGTHCRAGQPRDHGRPRPGIGAGEDPSPQSTR
jgi:hypothetical protein